MSKDIYYNLHGTLDTFWKLLPLKQASHTSNKRYPIKQPIPRKKFKRQSNMNNKASSLLVYLRAEAAGHKLAAGFQGQAKLFDHRWVKR